MKVTIKGGSTVTLTQSNFVAEGGEGKVFRIGDEGFKIYADPKKAIPFGKIQELADIKDPRVIKPLTTIANSRGKHVGHTFRFVSDTHSLVTLLTKAFRTRMGLTNTQLLGLVEKLQEGIISVHDAGSVIVDLNEFNFLIAQDFSDIFFIDVDSYKTKSYPATAIMPSVRDWHTAVKDFNDGSDWFSFACIATRLFVCTHPYKGTHPDIKGMEARMKANISIFNPVVNRANGAIPLASIPKMYRGWLEAVLEKGDRSAPPSGTATAVAFMAPIRIVKDSSVIHLTSEMTMEDQIRVASWSQGSLCALSSQSGKYKPLNGMERRFAHSFPAGTEIFWTEKSNTPLFSYIVDGAIQIRTIEGKTVRIVCESETLTVTDGRLYSKFDDFVVEIKIHEARQDFIANTAIAANVMPYASKLFEGVVIQSLMGDIHVNLFTESGVSHQVRIPELDKVRTYEMKYQNRVLMALVAGADGAYSRYIFRFANDFTTYSLRKVDKVNPNGVNFATLDVGVCVSITEEEKIEIFSNDPAKDAVKVLEDPNISGDMNLINNSAKLTFYRDCEVSSLKMGK